MRLRLSSKPFETILFVGELSTLRNHKASTTFAQAVRTQLQGSGRGKPPASHILAHDEKRLPPEVAVKSAQAEAEAFKLKKDHLEVLALTRKPFEEPCPRMQTPWPGLKFLVFC